MSTAENKETLRRRKTKTLHPYNNFYCTVYKVIDGQIKEMTQYLDTELVTAAFGR